MNAPAKIETPRGVYAKIAAVQGELAKVGISKSRRNQQQGYNFRGIDEVYAALSPLLATNGLVIVPRVISRECVEGQTRKGDPLFRVTVHAEFDFISADDGSIHTASTFGEAMDSADKATNKAMSAAYKYAAFMTFAIPTEGDNDADASHHEPAPRQVEKPKLDPTAKINDKARHALQDLIIKSGGDVSQFCRDHQLTSLADVTNAQAAELAAPLKAKLAGQSTPFGELADDQIPY